MNKLKQILKLDSPSFKDAAVIKNKDCKEIEVDKWLISDFVSERISPLIKNRPFPLDEQMLMVTAVCLVKPELIFDWGTHIGKSARIFYETVKRFDIPCEIHSIDLPDDVEHVEHPGHNRGHLVRGLSNVALHQGDGVDTAISIYKKTNPERVLFYVDGDHSYKSVKRELKEIIKSTKKPAILLHDTFMQTAESGYNTGPHRAIKDTLRELRVTPKKVQTALGLPGMTLLIF